MRDRQHQENLKIIINHHNGCGSSRKKFFQQNREQRPKGGFMLIQSEKSGMMQIKRLSNGVAAQAKGEEMSQ